MELASAPARTMKKSLNPAAAMRCATACACSADGNGGRYTRQPCPGAGAACSRVATCCTSGASFAAAALPAPFDANGPKLKHCGAGAATSLATAVVDGDGAAAIPADGAGGGAGVRAPSSTSCRRATPGGSCTG